MAVSRTDFDNFSIIQDADTDHTVEVDVMGGPCRVTDIHFSKTGGTAKAYLKLYDDTAPTVGTTAPEYIFEIPVTETGDCFPLFGKHLKFVNGLSFACTLEDGTGGTATTPDGEVVITLGLLKGVS